jgi:hypothetical protein
MKKSEKIFENKLNFAPKYDIIYFILQWEWRLFL